MWYRALAFAALLLWPASSVAALAVDAASSSACTSCTSLTWSHTTSGTNRGLTVGGSYFDSDSAITGITYAGAAMTAVASSFADNGNYSAEHYALIAPATGANNVVITASVTMTELNGGAISFTDANQTTLVGTAVTAIGTSTTPSVAASSAANEIVVDNVIIAHNGTFSVGAGQTQRWNAIGGAGWSKYGGSTEPGGPTTTMSWTNSTSQDWAISAVSIKPVAVAAGVVPSLLLMGVGQ